MIKKVLLSLTILAMISAGAVAQVITINGTVLDGSNEPIIGANIVEKGTENGTITDFDGHFTLSVSEGAKIVVTYVGFKAQELDARSSMSIVLSEDAEALEEVVVVGYGTQKKANLTGAVSTVDVGKQLEAKPNSDIARSLQGAVPGLLISNSAGGIDNNPTIQIRGVGTLSNDATSSPLIVVDGVPMDDISYLNSNDIESISVLKDAASTSIYGTRAAFGVLLIQTKGAKKGSKFNVTYSDNFSWSNPTFIPDYPTVSEQGLALYTANTRVGAGSELFGIYMDQEHDFFNKADAWLTKHGGKKSGYREMKFGNPLTTDGDYDGDGFYADWDVIGIMFRDWRFSQNHNVSVSGSSDHINYYLSFGYDHHEGVLNFNPDKRDKYNINMNLTSDLTKWLQIGAKVQINMKDYTHPQIRRSNMENSYDIYQYLFRWGSMFEPLGYFVRDGVQYDAKNSIAYLKQAGDATYNNMYSRMTAFLKLAPVKGLTINADFTYNIENIKLKQNAQKVVGVNTWGLSALNKGNDMAVEELTNTNFVRVRNTNNNSYAFNAYATYDVSTPNKHHNFKVMVGANLEEGTRYRADVKRMGLLDENLPELNLATKDLTSDNNYHNSWGTAGFFLRFNYNWKDILLLEFNGRADGSSKFPSDSRWAFFPSGSAGYRLSEHEFFKPIKDVWSNLKIRASFGQIGNQEIGSNMFIATINNISSGNVNWVGSGDTKVVAFDLPKIVAANLGWERIQTADVGIDLGFFHNEFNVSFDWYQRNTKDMLAPKKALPGVLGADAPKENAGELRTRGWELSADYHHTFHNARDLTFYVNFNIGDYKTKIVEWDTDSKLLNTNYSGKTVGDIWGFETDRLYTIADFDWNQTRGTDAWYKGASQVPLERGSFKYGPGDIKFKDKNGDGVINYGDDDKGTKGTEENHGDLVKIGNTTPRYQYGIRLGLEWKGIDLDMYFQGVGKRQMWQTGQFNVMYARGTDGLYDTQTDYYGAYNNPLKTQGTTAWGNGSQQFYEQLERDSRNKDAFYAFPFGGNQTSVDTKIFPSGRNNFYPQTRYLLNAAYCRFKTLTVGYTIPAKYTKKAYIQKLRVYFTAENLCELFNGMKRYKIDPEITDAASSGGSNGTWGRVDPMDRSLSFGLQVTF